MKIQNSALQSVLGYVKQNPGAFQAQIMKGTGLSEAIVREALNQLKADGQVTGTKAGKRVEYTIVKQAKGAKTTANTKVVAKVIVQPAKPKSDPKKGRNFGRNFNRFVFNGSSYHKGKLVDAIIREHVKKVNPTLTELKGTFPDSLLKTYGILQEISVAKEKPGRYFTHKGIVLKDGKKIAVCNQWTSENIQPVLGVAKKLGYKVTAEKA